MAAGQPLARHIRCPSGPRVERQYASGLLFALAPQYKDRTGESSSRSCIACIVLQVLGSSGSIVFAHGVAHMRTSERGSIGVEGQGIDPLETAGHLRQCSVQISVRVSRKHPLREIARLRQEEPVPGVQSESLVDRCECIERRYHGQRGICRDALRMVERKPVSGPSAPVVPDHRESLVPEPAHQLDERAGYATFGPTRLIVAGAAVAVPRQIGHDNGVRPRERRRNQSPRDVGLRVTVQEHNRRSAPADPAAKRDIARFDVEAREARKKVVLDSMRHAHLLVKRGFIAATLT